MPGGAAWYVCVGLGSKYWSVAAVAPDHAQHQNRVPFFPPFFLGSVHFISFYFIFSFLSYSVVAINQLMALGFALDLFWLFFFCFFFGWAFHFQLLWDKNTHDALCCRYIHRLFFAWAARTIVLVDFLSLGFFFVCFVRFSRRIGWACVRFDSGVSAHRGLLMWWCKRPPPPWLIIISLVDYTSRLGLTISPRQLRWIVCCLLPV